MISYLARPSLFVSAAAVPILAGLLLVGCSDGDSTPPQSEASPSVAENDTAAPPPYLLDTCVVSGEKLGSMGEPIVIQLEGRTVKLCCAGCEDQLRADPAKYLAKLDNPTANDTPPADGHDHDQHGHH